MEKETQLQKEIILAHLERDREVWMGEVALSKREPCGETFERRNGAMHVINEGLEELFNLINPYETTIETV